MLAILQKFAFGAKWKSVMISLLKVILAQGSPFPPNSVKPFPEKIMLGSFLLVGIVLSNCYKNGNLSKIVVVSRKPVLPQSFGDLA